MEIKKAYSLSFSPTGGTKKISEHIAAGVCDYHIEDQVFRLTPGGMLVIPPNLMHYAEVVGDEVLVNFDIFTPKREEYVK